jgi:hypothetical protein
MRADIHDGQGAKTLRSMGRIQKRETNYLQIVKSGLHRTAGPYRCAISGLTQRSKKDRYSMTSSAAISKPGGTVKPSAFAVLRLTTVSNFVGVCTGRSAGFAPRRMRST